MDLNFDNFTIVQVFTVSAVIAAIDVLGTIALSIVHSDFNLGSIAVWLQSHTLKRVFPILALAVIGNGVPQLGVPAIGPAFVMAIAGLVAYAGETIKSISVSFNDTTPPTNTDPQS